MADEVDWSSLATPSGPRQAPATEPAVQGPPSAETDWTSLSANKRPIEDQAHPGYQPAHYDISGPASYLQAAGSELARTPEFLPHPSDVLGEVTQGLRQGYGALTAPTPAERSWWQTVPSRAAGVLEMGNAVYTTPFTSVGGHLFGTGLHGVGSVLAPNQAALQEADRYDPNAPERSAFAPLAHDLSPAKPGQPYRMYEQIGKPVAELASMLAVPRGIKPAGELAHGVIEGPTTPLFGQRLAAMGPKSQIPLSARQVLPTAAIHTAGSQQFKEMENLGIMFKEDSLANAADAVQTNLFRRFSPEDRDYATIYKTIAPLGKRTTPGTFNDVYTTISQLGSLRTDPKLSKPATEAAHGLVDYLSNLQPRDFYAPSAQAASRLAELLPQARGNWAVWGKLGAPGGLENRLQSAEIAARKFQPEGGAAPSVAKQIVNEATKMRQRPETYLRNPTSEQTELLRRAQEGTWRDWGAAKLGLLAPEMPTTPRAGLKDIALGAGHYFLGDPFTSVPITVAAYGARHLAEQAPTRHWQQLIKSIQETAPAAQQAAKVPSYTSVLRVIPKAAIPAALQAAHEMTRRQASGTSPTSGGNMTSPNWDWGTLGQ